MIERIGLFGGSFNPIHVGHLMIARAVLERLALQRMIFLPAANPPHKPRPDLWPAEHRAEMVRRAIQGEPRFEFNDFDLARPGLCYTVDTVAHFRAANPDAELFWVIGADSLIELPTWHRAAELCDACRIVTAQRSDSADIPWDHLQAQLGTDRVTRLRADVIPTPRVDIASTEIRARRREGRSIRYLVPDTILEYLEGCATAL